MRISLLLSMGITCIGLIYGQAQAENYLLTIDGKKHEVDLDKQTTITLPGGKTIQVTLEAKPVLTFKTEWFAFDHPKEAAATRTDLGDGVHQTMMMTPSGTLVMIQEYERLDPSNLVDLMLNELTKEKKQYGYEITKNPDTMKLVSGIELKGVKSVEKYKGDESTHQVLCHAVTDGGIMIITQIDKDAPATDLDMIETFWKTLSISLK